MDSVSDWQHPFVDVFKRYNTFDAPRSYKGSVNVIHVLSNLNTGPHDRKKMFQIIRLNIIKQFSDNPRPDIRYKTL